MALTHLSASRFGRVFKEVYGETPHHLLGDERTLASTGHGQTSTAMRTRTLIG